MRAAKAAGYIVALVFVGLSSADLNVERVAYRVARGGHHIPEDVIRRRYTTSLERLREAIGLADETLVFDNSQLSGPKPLLEFRAGQVTIRGLDMADNFHRRLAEVAASALGLSTDELIRTGNRS